MSRTQALRRAEALSALGRKLFLDPRLSRSGKLACATCHDPQFAYGPPDARPVQSGGKDGTRWGTRAAPSLKYLQVIPQFAEHAFDASVTGDDSVDTGPSGGLTWDGRVDRGRDQARIPLLSPDEMANESPADVVARARNASYAGELRMLAGNSADVETVFNTILEALETWQQDYREFYPYSSKYDAWLAGKTELSPQERRGFELFTDANKGDCARCHIAKRGVDGTPPQFTDYGLLALGLPRNPYIPANLNPDWYDLGMCGPYRTDLRSKTEYCGRFMTPTLRNVATRKTFFHNGIFHTLKDAVAFYAQRDSSPEKWYPRDRDGRILKFNDLPAQYHGNVEMGSPFGREVGSTPVLSDGEIEDLVEFLKALTDGFDTAKE